MSLLIGVPHDGRQTEDVLRTAAQERVPAGMVMQPGHTDTTLAAVADDTTDPQLPVRVYTAL